jgi:cell division protein FtsQ
LVCSGLLTLLIAAKSKQHLRTCSQVLISVNGGEKIYIDKSDILKILSAQVSGPLINKPLDEFNLSSLEKALQKHPWIKNAQLFFDDQDMLHVLVMEREPVVRVLTKSNAGFYLDSAGARMPLLEKVTIRLPVVSDFPDYKKPSAKDSALLKDLKGLVAFIDGNDFWKAQIAQIDVTDQYDFELVPVVGNHIIRFGKGDNVADKFNRLLVFYKQVLCKTGFDKYRIVDVQYADQIVGVKKEAVAKVDSILLQKNIETLMSQTHLQEADQQQPEVLTVPVNGYGPQLEQGTPLVPQSSDSLKTDPISLKKEPVKKDMVKALPVVPKNHPAAQDIKSNTQKTKVKAVQKPKAVMHRANEY